MSDPILDRRTILRAAAGTAVALPALSSPAAAAAAAGPAGFPSYAYLGRSLNTSALRYNPTGELIFPCVRGTYDRMPGGLGRYYLYYAPHDAPGGICLAYGDSLAGPFTEYHANPIVSRAVGLALQRQPRVVTARALARRLPPLVPVLPRREQHDPARHLGQRGRLQLPRRRAEHLDGARHLGGLLRAGLRPRDPGAGRPVRDGVHGQPRRQPQDLLGLVGRRGELAVRP
ncbi:hypothetical protein ACFSTC_31615 [Nonomuraea ferruginea]